jgi:hypothetical protein
MTGLMNEAALAELRTAAVKTEELLAKRRDRLAVVELEIKATERRIADRERAQAADRLALVALYEERGRQRGHLDARRLNGGAEAGR